MNRNDWPRLSPHGMVRCPWRRGKRWDVRPAGIIEPHAKPTGGHSGDVPRGKLQKSKRLKDGPPGSARGTCINLYHPGECHCGKHWDMPKPERQRLVAQGAKR